MIRTKASKMKSLIKTKLSVFDFDFRLTHFRAMLPLYIAPENIRMFSGGIEKELYSEIGG